MTEYELMRAIRDLRFGFHLFTYGDHLFKLTLIDWSDVEWVDDTWDADTLHALLTKAHKVALKRREVIPQAG